MQWSFPLKRMRFFLCFGLLESFFVGFDERRFLELLIPVFGVTAVFRGVLLALSDVGWLPQELCVGQSPVSWQ